MELKLMRIGVGLQRLKSPPFVGFHVSFFWGGETQ